MKTFLALVLFLGSHITKADTLDDQIHSLSKRIGDSVYSTSNRLTSVEKKQLIKSLSEVSYNLEKIGCEKDADNYQATFTAIHKFASGALRGHIKNANEYALEWTKKYPCSYVDRFFEDFFRVRGTASNRLLLNLDSKTATEYALKYSQNLCEDYELEIEFERIFKFAYSERGLDMNIANAKAYARRQVEKHGFSCRNY